MKKNYEVIQKEKWNRKEHYDFFSGDEGSPLYDVTVHLDVTDFHRYTKRNNLSFYYSLIWITTKVINQIDDFLYKIRRRDVIRYHRLIPAFTDLKTGSELFHIVVLDLKGSMTQFSEEAARVSKEQQCYFPSSLEEYEADQIIQFSCAPWFSFTSFNSEKSNDPDDSIPKIIWGRYEQFGERLRLPFSIQVNHRLIDGFHLGKLFTLLQRDLDQFSEE